MPKKALIKSRRSGWRVSLVMPCYNKQAFLGRMLDTVLAQTFDSIELVLVNDGSSDNTRKIIASYEPLFAQRGFKTLIIDQANAGVCAAAQKGLVRATGDYVCLVDADDELDHAYVSTMADWLDNHPTCDFVICGGDEFIETDQGRLYRRGPSAHIPTDDNSLGVANFLFGEIIRQTVWIYLVRRSYLDRCGIVKSYHVGTYGSHEPGYVIPLLAHGGRRKYIPQALYHFNESGEGHSQTTNITRAQEFYDLYGLLCEKAIDALPHSVAGACERRFFRRLSLLSKEYHLYRRSVVFQTDAQTQAFYRLRLTDAVNQAFSLDPPLVAAAVEGREDMLVAAFLAVVFDRKGTAASLAFPMLRGADLHA
jgi:glycosyltransferase involved in cell wall biosynthesis